MKTQSIFTEDEIWVLELLSKRPTRHAVAYFTQGYFAPATKTLLEAGIVEYWPNYAEKTNDLRLTEYGQVMVRLIA